MHPKWYLFSPDYTTYLFIYLLIHSLIYSFLSSTNSVLRATLHDLIETWNLTPCVDCVNPSNRAYALLASLTNYSLNASE